MHDVLSRIPGIQIHVNEEIPPDRIVFYDQFDAVYSTVTIPDELLPDVIAAGVRAKARKRSQGPS